MLTQNKHRQILVRILKDIYDDHELARALGFKGGTMAYLFYDLPRFSVDLDFDLLDDASESTVSIKIKAILEKYGEIKQEDNKRYSIFFMLSYEAGQHNIKIDINKRDFESKYEVKSYLGIDMLCMQRGYMVAHKMVAMYERMEEATRDIFDVHYFLAHHFEYDKETIEKRVGTSFAVFVDRAAEGLSVVQSNQLLGGLGELIDEKQKYWVKNKMLPETILLLKLLDN